MSLTRSVVYMFKCVIAIIRHIPITYWMIKYKFLLRRRHKKSVETEEEEDVQNQVVVITGANRGMGKEMALQFAKRGAKVVLGCRDVVKGKETVEEISTVTGNHKLRVFHLDLNNMDSVERFAAAVSKRYKRIKILINNAGYVGSKEDMNNTTFLVDEELCNTILTVNHLGPFLLTNLLLESLKNGSPSRVVMMSSQALLFSELSLKNLSFRKCGYSVQNNQPYCNSKHCNALFAMELSKRINHLGITTCSLCPGMVDTDIFVDFSGPFGYAAKMSKPVAATTPEEAVKEFVLPVALWKKFYSKSGKMYLCARPFGKANRKIAKEKELSIKIWNLSAYLVQVDERRKRLNLDKAVCI